MAERFAGMVGQAVADAMAARDAQEHEAAQQAEHRSKIDQLRAKVRRHTAPSPLQGSLPGGGGGQDSWLRGLQHRRMWGLRYLPATGVSWHYGLFGSVDPYLAGAVVDPAAMATSLTVFTVGPAVWWATRWIHTREYIHGLLVRIGLSAGAAGAASAEGGGIVTDWLYDQGVDPSMTVPFAAGAYVTAALCWLVDRRSYRLPWLFGWIPLIPSTTVALATTQFVIDF
ncbi:hypothetical protein [Streptomyces hydrogenans]|uniref:hypothetical protein n=1 Tax=Streptomyces hydrogenans TaxID=1873719 RepID=UPI0037F61B9B